jgi:hypothetical protein
VEHMEHERGAVVMQGRIPGRMAAQFAKWTIAEPASPSQQEDE